MTNLNNTIDRIRSEFEDQFIKKRADKYVWLRGLFQEDIETFFDKAIKDVVKETVESLRMKKRIMNNPVPDSDEVIGYNEAVNEIRLKLDSLLKETV